MSDNVRYHLSTKNRRADAAVIYVLDHLGRDYNLLFQRVQNKEDAEICIGDSTNCDFELAIQPLLNYFQGGGSVQPPFEVLEGTPMMCINMKPDYILSAFVLLSGMQEWVSNRRDKWGRFPYKGSLQEEYGEAQEAWVDHYFERIYEALKSKLDLVSREKPPTDIVLTHDIDLLRWPIFQNSNYFFKKDIPTEGVGAIKKTPSLLSNTRKNIADILALENQFDVHSIFFWLTESGRGKYGIMNADYSINSSYVSQTLKEIEQAKGVNGLHKSSKQKTLLSELQSLTKLSPINRYHFLLFNLSCDGQELDHSVKQDYSYGFADQMGFRNAYSRPFHPFDFQNWAPFHFLEIPLHIMDNTFITYLDQAPDQAEKRIIRFLDKNRMGSCISILWHNEYYTPFKYSEWAKVYQNILEYLFVENNYKSILPTEIDTKYRIY